MLVIASSGDLLTASTVGILTGCEARVLDVAFLIASSEPPTLLGLDLKPEGCFINDNKKPHKSTVLRPDLA